jgi:hypothetical protein
MGTIPSTLDLPLTLGAAQAWTIDEAQTPFDDAVSEDEPLTVDFSNGSSVYPTGGVEGGDVTAPGDGGFYLNGGMAVNSTNSNPFELENGGGIEANQSNNSVGPVTVDANGWSSVGGVVKQKPEKLERACVRWHNRRRVGQCRTPPAASGSRS